MVVKWHYTAFIALRVLQGCFEGVTFPSMHAATAMWVPPEERSSFIAKSFFGSMIGNVITFPLCGYLASSLGWESAFYVIGSLTVIWFGAWCLFVFDTPDKHPRISEEERERIKAALREVNCDEVIPIPWKKVMTSVPFISLIVADCNSTFGAMIFFTNWPTYLSYMLGMDMKSNGLLSALPFVCRYVGGLVHGKIADILYVRRLMSLVNIRRLFNTICMLGPALALVLLSWSGCNTTYAVTTVCAGFFFNGALSPGHFSSYTDLAPNIAGSLFGISNTFSGGGVGLTVPLFIGAMTQGAMTFASWRMVFLTGAAMYAVGAAVFVFFISADVQPWNCPQEKKESEEIGADN